MENGDNGDFGTAKLLKCARLVQWVGVMRLFQPLLLVLAWITATHAADPEPLTLERKIPLGKVSGRIDHFAFDAKGHRLFLAELGNDTVSVVNVENGVVEKRIEGVKEPQGVAYVAETNALYVASGDDGSVRVFRGDDFQQAATIEFKDDADNLRVDAANHLVYVGYGSGAIAAIDARTMTKGAIIPLKSHPEGFQLEPKGNRIFVNVPSAREVAVLDRSSGQQVGSWKAPAVANFPMAVRADGSQVFTVYRLPARLVAYDTKSGNIVFNVSTCGDADDVFLDAKRERAYVSCGSGGIDVFQVTPTNATHVTEINTSSGARTAFYDADLDRLFLAVRATSKEPAAIWVYRPTPPP